MSTITYKEAIKRGFNRIESEDKVWFDKHGYDYFIVTLDIRNYGFDWCPENHTINFYKNNKLVEKNITVEQLDYLIELLK